MASERDLELLDDYLTNRLKGGEKSEFEQRLQRDPDLQSELRFHEQIAEGLKKARVAELKGRLNRIPVSGGADYSQLAKWAGVGAVVIGAGIYFYLKNPDSTISPAPAVSELREITPAPAIDQSVDSPATDAVAETSKGNVTEAPAKPSTPRPATKATVPQSAADPRKVEVFDPTADSESEAGNSAPDIDLPVAETEGPVTSRSVNVVDNSRKYDFHYELKGDELTLYGHFEKNLYTIMEFKSENKETVIFMFYKNNYYLLNQSPGKVNRLIPVNDPVLLNRLRQQRGTE